MHIAHSKLQPAEEPTLDLSNKKTKKQVRAELYDQFKKEMAYKGWVKACKVLADEIKEIQEHIPGWMPTLKTS